MWAQDIFGSGRVMQSVCIEEKEMTAKKKEVSCDCEEWINSADQIFSVQILHTIRTGVKYTGSVWNYCPWCGKKLIVEWDNGEETK